MPALIGELTLGRAFVPFFWSQLGFERDLDARGRPAGRLGQRGLWLVVDAAHASVLAVAFSRVYLGAHWFTDVLAGLFVGAAWAFSVVLAHRIWVQVRRREHRSVGAGTLAVDSADGAAGGDSGPSHDAPTTP